MLCPTQERGQDTKAEFQRRKDTMNTKTYGTDKPGKASSASGAIANGSSNYNSNDTATGLKSGKGKSKGK